MNSLFQVMDCFYSGTCYLIVSTKQYCSRRISSSWKISKTYCRYVWFLLGLIMHGGLYRDLHGLRNAKFTWNLWQKFIKSQYEKVLKKKLPTFPSLFVVRSYKLLLAVLLRLSDIVHLELKYICSRPALVLNQHNYSCTCDSQFRTTFIYFGIKAELQQVDIFSSSIVKPLLIWNLNLNLGRNRK